MSKCTCSINVNLLCVFCVCLFDNRFILCTAANAKENANNTYVVELNLPKGEHKVNIFAHNPVGWSEDNHGSYFLTVINGSSRGSMVNWTLTLVAIVMCSWFKLN